MRKQNTITKKLLSYSAMAGAFLAIDSDAVAQCGTADAANPILPVDIDGDGINDININFVSGSSFLGTVTTSSYIGNITGTIPYTYNFTFTFGTTGTYYGCVVGQLAGGTAAGGMTGFPALGPQVYGPVYAPCDYSVAGLYYLTFLQASTQYNVAFATPIGSNQLIGQTAGDSVCGPLGSGYVAGGTNTFAPLALNQSLCILGGTYYLLYTMFTQACPPVPTVGSYMQTIVGTTCTTSLGLLAFGPAVQNVTYLVGSFYVSTTGLFAAASGTIPSLGCTPTSTFTGSNYIGVQFDGPDGTHYGWVEVTINPDGTITCTNTGYNGCSVEEVMMAGAAAGTQCIAAGDATLNLGNEACMPPVPTCSIDAVGASAAACVDPGTPATPGDDTVVITVNPTGMADDGAGNMTPLAGSYTISGLPTTTTGTFGTPVTETVPADGTTYTITVTYTDADGTTCTADMMVTVDGPCSNASPSCSIDTVTATAAPCDDAGTPDGADDTAIITVDVMGTSDDGNGNTAALTGSYTITGLPTTTTGTFGTPVTETVPADGSTYTVMISYTDPSDPNVICTGSATVTVDPACSVAAPVCDITTSVSSMCDDNGTPDDPSDDITTVMVTVNNADPVNFPTFTDDQGNAGVAYGTVLTYMVTGTAGLTVNYTDDTDGACTDSISVTTGCETVENIPTVGEWGLIILGLMMSITAIVGIRQRREEEVTA